MKNFRKAHTFQEREKESNRIREKYPERIPVIVEKSYKCKYLSDLEKKYLVPNDITVGQLCYIVRRRLTLSAEKALFLFIDNKLLPASSELIGKLYETEKNKDGFLYVTYCSENTFG